MIKVIDVKEILRLLSRILLLLIGALLVNTVIAWFIGDPYMPFVITAGVAGLLSFVFYLGKRRCKTESRFRLKEAYITVISSWVLFSLIGTLPYLISGAIPSFIDAFFETVSGFTTTGSSILTDIESLPMSVLFWRSFSHWLGGIGIVVLFIVIMPGLKIGGYHLFTLESSLQEKVEPRVKRVGLSILKIYILLTVIETGLLLFGGMNLFESVTHAFGTIATGGFSPKNDSLAGYSPYIQYVVMIFMLLSGTNFIIHYYLLTHNYNKIKKNEELRFYLLVVLLSGLLITVVLFFKLGKPLETSFRDSFFQIVSVITCTGYATADYLQWPSYAWFFVFLLMFLGGSTGSTAGGIKIVRHVVFFKNISLAFKKIREPKAVLSLKLNGKTVSNKTNSMILNFIVLYFMLFFLGSTLLIFNGIDLQTSFGAVATAMAGIGPGIGTVGPADNFAHLPNFAKALLPVLMILGRLEIYTILALFTKDFWNH